MTEITLPHQFLPRSYQFPVFEAFDSGFKRGVLIWHRRSGKDLCAINLAAKKAFERVGTYYHILPFYNQGRKAIWDGIDRDGIPFLDHFPKELIRARNEQEMRIEFKNGSAWQVIGSDKIDAVVGTNPIGVVFSEYSLQKPDAWELIRPILAENGGWALFVYTPRGMNHGYKLLQQAKQAKWFVQILTVDDTNCIPKDILAEEEKQMSNALFRQEYYCEFIEGAGQFFRRITENLWDGQLEPEEGRSYQIGADLAKYNDFTVLTPLDLNTFSVGQQERFNQLDYNLQKSRIEAMSYKFNGARIILDSTGVGEPIFDDLSARGLPVDPYRFNDNSRKDLLNNLAILLEQGKVKLPNDPELLDELRGMQYELTELGKTKIVSVTDHDDRVMSLALACWGIREPVRQAKDEDFSIYRGQKFS